ncbi:hypothetical protein [Legionella genomosp. 1]|uniref:hypothetical protein n=1 Tax=Legionella genomosp. 1 TaxID=1093625 RepID=UPI0010549736|nr:hypothetical protein [Legionella genomosp. 1]
MKGKAELGDMRQIDFTPLKETLIQILQVNLKLMKEKQDQERQERKDKSIFYSCICFFSDAPPPLLSSIELDRALTRIQSSYLKYFYQDQKYEAAWVYSIWDKIASINSLNMTTLSLHHQARRMNYIYSQLIDLYNQINTRITAILNKEFALQSHDFSILFKYVTTKQQYEALKKSDSLFLEEHNFSLRPDLKELKKLHNKVDLARKYFSCKKTFKQLKAENQQVLYEDYLKYNGVYGNDLKLAILKNLAPESYEKVCAEINEVLKEFKENYLPDDNDCRVETVYIL